MHQGEEYSGHHEIPPGPDWQIDDSVEKDCGCGVTALHTAALVLTSQLCYALVALFI